MKQLLMLILALSSISSCKSQDILLNESQIYIDRIKKDLERVVNEEKASIAILFSREDSKKVAFKILPELSNTKINYNIALLDTFISFENKIERSYKTFDQIGFINDCKMYKSGILKNKVERSLITDAGINGSLEIEKYLLSTVNDRRFDQDHVKLALARLQIEPYHTEMVNRFSVSIHLKEDYKDFDIPLDDAVFLASSLKDNYLPNLTYIRSQESMLAISEWLDYNYTYPLIEIENSDSQPVATFAQYFLIKFIRNEDFQSKIDELYAKQKRNRAFTNPSSMIPKYTQEEFDFVRKWMISNFGNYEIDTDSKEEWIIQPAGKRYIY